MENSPPPADGAADSGGLHFSNLPLPAKYSIAARHLASGLTDAQVLEQLLTLDVEPELVALMVANLRAEQPGGSREDEMQQAAQKDMLHGALWCGGGLLVSGATYALAGAGGGFVVTWGAIIFGAIQFFRGGYNSRSKN